MFCAYAKDYTTIFYVPQLNKERNMCRCVHCKTIFRSGIIFHPVAKDEVCIVSYLINLLFSLMLNECSLEMDHSCIKERTSVSTDFTISCRIFW